MQTDMIIAGVGGQGILTISAIIGEAVLQTDLRIKQSEVHGMAQRGGAVVSHLRINQYPPSTGLVPRHQADLLLGLEPLETIRHLDWLKPTGQIISSIDPIKNIPGYPELELLLNKLRLNKNSLLLKASELAAELNFKRGTNTLLLGAATYHLPLKATAVKNSLIKKFASQKDSILEKNLALFERGLQLAKQNADL